MKHNQDNMYAVDRFNHSATIQTLGNNQSVIAFYTGPQECHDKQRVAIIFNDQGKIASTAELENLTGNPILFLHGDKLRIIYSKFEEFPRRKAHWWQFCSTWQRSISLIEGELLLGEPKQIFVEEPPVRNIRTDMELVLNHNPNSDKEFELPRGIGYVPRCKVLEFNGIFYLPLYREHDPHYHSVILSSEDGESWEYHSRIGVDEDKAGIQPCLWHDGKTLHALMRNFGRVKRVLNYQPRALYSTYDFMAKSWTPMVHSLNYFNANNSIATLQRENGHPWVVWNDSQSGRDKLALGYRGQKLIYLDVSYGSYPDLSADHDTLHVVYTGRSSPYRIDSGNVIKHKMFSLQALEKTALKVDQTLG